MSSILLKFNVFDVAKLILNIPLYEEVSYLLSHAFALIIMDIISICLIIFCIALPSA